MEAIPVPARRFSYVHVDLVGPLAASSQGHTYLLTILDRTSPGATLTAPDYP